MDIVWDPRDRIYVVNVPELPLCHTHGATYVEAVTKGQEAIESYLYVLLQDGTPLPPPRTYDDED